MRLSVIVAFRDTDGTRTRLWSFIRQRLEAQLPEAEIVVGTDDGIDPFHKTLALNRAAALATGDVFLLTDTDTWVPTAGITEALAGTWEQWWRPWRVKVKLGEADTAAVLNSGTAWDGLVTPEQVRRRENRNAYWSAPPLMFTREMWERVRGMDERFRGWGQEDDAFAASLVAFYGKSRITDGTCVHLWHHRIGRSGRDLWLGQATNRANMALGLRYRSAMSDPAGMQALIAERQEAA